jgi:transcription elongation factor Elf1
MLNAIYEELSLKKRSRQTTVTCNPDTPPPVLACPECRKRLVFERTVLGGIRPPERWDVFRCKNCGQFEYRHRTKQLRRVD